MHNVFFYFHGLIFYSGEASLKLDNQFNIFFHTIKLTKYDENSYLVYRILGDRTSYLTFLSRLAFDHTLCVPLPTFVLKFEVMLLPEKLLLKNTSTDFFRDHDHVSTLCTRLCL